MDWFWASFYYETWALDHAVGDVARAGEDTVITVEDRGFAFLPARIRIETTEGEVLHREIPVSHWLTGATRAEIRIPVSQGEVARVAVDARAYFPDLDPENNVWVRR